MKLQKKLQTQKMTGSSKTRTKFMIIKDIIYSKNLQLKFKFQYVIKR